MHMQVRSASNSLTLTHQPCKPERPTTQSSRSSLQVWWAKVQEYEPSCVPKMNRGAWFLLLILDWFSSSNRKLRINPKKRSGDQPWDKGPPNFLQAQAQVQAIGLETYEHMEQCSRRPSRCFHLRLLLRLHRIGFGSHFRSNLIRCHTNHIGCNTGCLGMSPPQPASHSPQLRSAAPAAGLPTPSSPPMHQLRPPSSFLSSSSHPSLDPGLLDVLLRPSPVQHASQVQFIAQPQANKQGILEHNFHPIKCINPDLSPKTIMIELLNRLGYDESSIR